MNLKIAQIDVTPGMKNEFEAGVTKTAPTDGERPFSDPARARHNFGLIFAA